MYKDDISLLITITCCALIVIVTILLVGFWAWSSAEQQTLDRCIKAKETGVMIEKYCVDENRKAIWLKDCDCKENYGTVKMEKKED